MTVSMTQRLAIGLLTATLAACTSTSRDNEVAADTPKENMKEGWRDIKEGSREVAEGVGDATKSAARETKEEVKEAGRELKASACPVIGNRVTNRYYTQADKEYPTMLKGEKILSADQRECFLSERAALDDGYSKAR